jgi:hypothetical protein
MSAAVTGTPRARLPEAGVLYLHGPDSGSPQVKALAGFRDGYPAFPSTEALAMTLRQRRPWQIEICSEQFCKSDNLEPKVSGPSAAREVGCSG